MCRIATLTVIVFSAKVAHPLAQDGRGADDVVLRAMVDELDRSMADLRLEELPKPYFISLRAAERNLRSIRAAYGGLVQSDSNRSRTIQVRSRVGSYALDNTNILRDFGQVGSLPLDDNYAALRHTIWLLLDRDYKNAVETLARKIAYLKDKAMEDRPEDFTPAKPVVDLQAVKAFNFDPSDWEQNAVQISARFKDHPQIQDSSVSLLAGTSIEWTVTSEGTRIRTSDTGLLLELNARLQAADGMPISDSRQYLALQPSELPEMDHILLDVDEMCGKLVSRSMAVVPDQYTGPVLFEARAAGVVFDTVMADGLCARPVPLGAGRWTEPTLENKLSLRILPRSFEVFDDPGPQRFDGTILAGSYEYDEEGVPASRVALVEKGILQTLLASRSPTKKIKKSTGHGRGGGFSDPKANIGCLYIQDANGLSVEELTQELLLAAKDEGLTFALRVESMEGGGREKLGSPINVYKVHVEDGREEPVRGLEFKTVETRALKRLLAAGRERDVYNSISPVGSSIIAPAILFEELELTKSEQEFDKPPILQSPLNRKDQNTQSPSG